MLPLGILKLAAHRAVVTCPTSIRCDPVLRHTTRQIAVRFPFVRPATDQHVPVGSLVAAALASPIVEAAEHRDVVVGAAQEGVGIERVRTGIAGLVLAAQSVAICSFLLLQPIQ